MMMFKIQILQVELFLSVVLIEKPSLLFNVKQRRILKKAHPILLKKAVVIFNFFSRHKNPPEENTVCELWIAPIVSR